MPGPPKMNVILDTTDLNPGESEAAYRVHSYDLQLPSIEKVDYFASLGIKKQQYVEGSQQYVEGSPQVNRTWT